MTMKMIDKVGNSSLYLKFEVCFKIISSKFLFLLGLICNFTSDVLLTCGVSLSLSLIVGAVYVLLYVFK